VCTVVPELEAFIRRQFRVKTDDAYFTIDSHLWEEGYVDSTGAIELIAHLEMTYGIRLSQETLFDPLFTTVRGIATLVERGMDRQHASVRAS
jgi:acyl carrier protein